MWGGGGQGGCDRRIEVFGKIHKKKKIGGVGGRGIGLVGGQGGCERRIEVFVKIQKKKFFWGGGSIGGVGLDGVRVDMIEEFKFWGKFTKKKLGGGRGGWVWGGRVGGGVRVNVNEELKFL